MSLDELSNLLQTTFKGELGKQTSSLVSKMISTKMPGEFNSNACAKYLENRWGFGPQRRQSVMLLAVALQPASRLNGNEEAKKFLDDASVLYASTAGIDLAALGTDRDASGSGSSVVLDSAAFEALTKPQQRLFTRQFELLASHLKLDPRAGDKALTGLESVQHTLQAKLDLWNTEHGEVYSSGISPIFSSLKVRSYNSYWNWARQDTFDLYYDILFARVKVSDPEVEERKGLIANRASQYLLPFLQHLLNQSQSQEGENNKIASQVILQLMERCIRTLKLSPIFKGTFSPTAPKTTVTTEGFIEYAEVPRDCVRTITDYVQEMMNSNREFECRNARSIVHSKPVFEFIPSHPNGESQHLHFSSKIYGQETPPETGFGEDANNILTERLPYLHLKQQFAGSGWQYNSRLTRLYLNSLDAIQQCGLTFRGKGVLVSGTGKGSIGAAILEGLLSGGARVIATTSRLSTEVAKYYQQLFACYGARGSQLVVVPFNQGSKTDVEAVVEYIYDTNRGLGWDLDYVLPFAAISEQGIELDSIDSKSELAHRIMLVNLIRLLGAIKKNKISRNYSNRPSQVILPLSPNHGIFGGDGLYSESKLGLETLFNKWRSENWNEFLTICGASIGWTRGTGLMSGNNLVAEEVEKLRVRTFSQQEMAFNILGLMSPAIVEECEKAPVYADLAGSLGAIPDLKDVVDRIRRDITKCGEIRKTVHREANREAELLDGKDSTGQVVLEPRANLHVDFPSLPDFHVEIMPFHETLKGMVDLEKVVVVTGFSELGPWGNSRTRWELEAYGALSLEGCIEMAWITGLIRHHNGPIKGRNGQYSGWIDSESGSPIEDKDVKVKYESHILQHSGIRFIEPELLDGRDNRSFQEIVIQEDFPPFEATRETAEELKELHGDRSDIIRDADTGQYMVILKAGAVVAVPRAINNNHLVAGQIPAGWDPRRYGITEDIINQVDKVTLYALVCTAEALLSSGITDAYELYSYVHVSEVGNCIGSGFGGGDKLRGIYKERILDKPVQNDVLQETFINTVSAWVNMLVLGSSGPLKTPVGACATAIESIDAGYEAIVSGKAKVCLVGGCDSYQEEIASEFGNMKATTNSKEELARGRTPREMSRPTASSRSGFVESEGAGVQVIMNAKLALEMGVPIHGIVALTATASDKIGRSVPAPGQGILTVSREERAQFSSPLLDIKYRREQLDMQLENIKKWQESELTRLRDSVKAQTSTDVNSEASEYLQSRFNYINDRVKTLTKEALGSWGNDFWKDTPSISPLRGALATWGLTIDDLNVVYLHGTSTVANDKNESDVINKQLHHLGRKDGNVVLAVCQKYLTGHPKGAAGSWMFNGGLQVLNTGLVPGNRNADNIDEKLEDFDLLFYPSRSIQTEGVKAFSVTSFGFGQKSAQAIGIHPKYLFATMDEAAYTKYGEKVRQRHKAAYRYLHKGMSQNTIFQAKETSPYTPKQETQVLLSPTARVSLADPSSPYAYPDRFPPPAKPSSDSFKGTNDYAAAVVEQFAKDSSSSSSTRQSIGVDIEEISSINLDSDTFIARNFSETEIRYCKTAPSPQASFAGRWSAKEAVFKSLGVAGKGSAASMRDIEIENDGNGVPSVKVRKRASSTPP